jgi:hypothetical protein
MENLWNSLKLGETVLLERTDSGDQYFGMYQLISWGLEKGYRIVIVDILDALHLNRMKMKLAGLDDSIVENPEVMVIKIGGLVETGNVVGKIEETKEPIILSRKFIKIYTPLLEGTEKKILTIAPGLERLFLAFSDSENNVQTVITGLSKHTGDDRRIAFQMVKTEVLRNRYPHVVNLLEDVATTVIRTKREGKQTLFTVVKSINKRIEGLEIKI